MPGLVDAHAFVLGLTVGQRIWPATPCGAGGTGATARRGRVTFRITTIRVSATVTITTLALRESIGERATVGPELVISGPPLTFATAGIAHSSSAGVADSVEELVDACRRRPRGERIGWVMAAGGFVTGIRSVAAAHWLRQRPTGRGGGGRRAGRSTGDRGHMPPQGCRGGRRGCEQHQRRQRMLLEAIVAQRCVVRYDDSQVYQVPENSIAVVQDGWRNIHGSSTPVRVSPCPPTLGRGRTPTYSPTIWCICLDTGSPAQRCADGATAAAAASCESATAGSHRAGLRR